MKTPLTVSFVGLLTLIQSGCATPSALELPASRPNHRGLASELAETDPSLPNGYRAFLKCSRAGHPDVELLIDDRTRQMISDDRVTRADYEGYYSENTHPRAPALHARISVAYGVITSFETTFFDGEYSEAAQDENDLKNHSYKIRFETAVTRNGDASVVDNSVFYLKMPDTKESKLIPFNCTRQLSL